MTGRVILTALLALMIVATAVADLGFMHAGNAAWPPHARLHAIWNVLHVAATHGLAIGLLWYGEVTRLRLRIAAAMPLAFIMGFFAAAAVAPWFGASLHPDLPAASRPLTRLGMDGNTIGFLVALPLLLYGWRRAERDLNQRAG